METHMVAFLDEALKASHLYTASRFFYGNQQNAPNFLSKSHFNYRLHRLPIFIWQKLFSSRAEYFKNTNSSHEYVVDSFPISVCDNSRIFRSKIVKGEQYLGYSANKKRFFYGLRARLLVTTKQEPVECVLAFGSETDMSVFKRFDLDLPAGSIIYADKAYNSYE